MEKLRTHMHVLPDHALIWEGALQCLTYKPSKIYIVMRGSQSLGLEINAPLLSSTQVIRRDTC